MVSRTNQILIVILVVQLIIGVISLLPESKAENVAGPLLADFSPDAVTGLVFRSTEGDELAMAKVDGVWVLPESDNFPLDESKVSSFLTQLAALQADRLIATSGSSQRRLGVAEDEFEAAVEIQQGERSDTLYIGTSGGVNVTHMRLGSSNDIYLTTGLTAWEADTRVGLWIDTVYFSVTQEDIVAVTLENANGIFEFEKVGGEWTMLELAEDEAFNAGNFTSLLTQLATVRMRAPLGMEGKEEYGLANPQATITIETMESLSTGEATAEPTLIPVTYTLRIGAQLEDGDYVLKSDQSDYYVALIEYTANNFLEKTRDSFLVASEELPQP